MLTHVPTSFSGWECFCWFRFGAGFFCMDNKCREIPLNARSNETKTMPAPINRIRRLCLRGGRPDLSGMYGIFSLIFCPRMLLLSSDVRSRVSDAVEPFSSMAVIALLLEGPE